MVVEQVPKARFKARALEYLRKVQETGQSIVILDRGRPVVTVTPFRGETEDLLRILRGSVRRYDDPTKPVAVDHWEALR
ncbi:MAG: type II toxin-antitoxin system prevent-host-death family antitoxin [Armatimonadota bacterium]|nr:type II toxin-antitoxin system prevent-host-death family antitoxin [Armatimonadota bacterium]MDR7421266.1 type II toxin-antitoxin system prevent-host-death family antitoxin [Armatimonadota bacterium]MDR7455289.1 type II toxin-antitoxin system prevent-host-death family antitoxin [Armatimonadota bacterium]MDR7455811.1 type II toxin-antitoxin system prevent-host-death family antitoxin [Armatimonadota bacterium]MDR7497916.1 type II toxin-antitoxin system prevent-host-death family antitoxin [Arma